MFAYPRTQRGILSPLKSDGSSMLELSNANTKKQLEANINNLFAMASTAWVKFALPFRTSQCTTLCGDEGERVPREVLCGDGSTERVSVEALGGNGL